MKEIDYTVLDTVDEPSSKDWTRNDFIEAKGEGAEGDTRKSFWDYEKMIVRNQFAQKTTYKGCTAYGLTYTYNGNNMLEWESVGQEYEQENPRWKWEAYQASRGRPNKGSTLQNMMRFFRVRKLIDGNVVAHGETEIKNALDNGYFIYTGTNKCSWKSAGRTGEFTYVNKGAGHAFAIVDYDEKGFIAINSFGKKRGNDGYFHIPFKYVKYLYSCNVIIDHDNTGSLQKLRDAHDIQKAIELGITNGADLDKPATREQVVLMIIRGLNVEKKS